MILSSKTAGAWGFGIAEFGIGDHRFPDEIAALLVERHELRIERGHIDEVAAQDDAAIVRPAAQCGHTQLVLVVPKLLAGCGIDGEDVIVGGCHIHDAVVDNRSSLIAPDHAGLMNPFELEIGDVVDADLVVVDKPLLTVIAAICRPSKITGLASGRRCAF